MASAALCPQCGAAIPSDAPRGHCPACLFAGVVGATAVINEISTAPGLTAPREGPGTRIGPYRLLQELGKGGMGVVWMAEQTEPVRRRVALKVIKLGKDTKEVIARFEAERQALALMDHPHIAKVFDAGTTDSGRPYFVMELVKGIPIAQYCDEQRLTIRERLELFLPVCQAIQHAHQKSIIHRDIKPSNVLVAQYDGCPVPKVIDFGVAKALGQQLTEKTLFTEFGAVIGTLEYMSPEQAEFNQLDIDTRSDIYSLGVLLYELLTGTTPLQRKSLQQAALDTVLRRIREEEPPRPSTRLSELNDALPTLSAQRKLEPGQLMKLVRGDLDWIVMMALEKERNRRYETANALASDVERHLKHEPVTAAAPSGFYKFQKFAHRNKAALVTATAFIVLLLVGVVLSAELAVRAKRAASKSQQVAEFLKDMLKGVRASVAMGRDATMVREILDKNAERVVTDLKGQPDVQADLLFTIGVTYANLGDARKAEALLRNALRLYKSLYGEEHPRVADSLHHLGEALMMHGLGPDAEAMIREAYAIRKKLFGERHLDVAESLLLVGVIERESGNLPEAEAMHRKALAIKRQLLGDEHPDVATALVVLAQTLESRDPLGAEAMIAEALTMKKKLRGEAHWDVAVATIALARVVERRGDWIGSEALQRQAIAIAREIHHPLLSVWTQNLARGLKQRGNVLEAEALYRDSGVTNAPVERSPQIP